MADTAERYVGYSDFAHLHYFISAYPNEYVVFKAKRALGLEP